jgi:hypothetical protein
VENRDTYSGKHLVYEVIPLVAVCLRVRSVVQLDNE